MYLKLSANVRWESTHRTGWRKRVMALCVSIVMMASILVPASVGAHGFKKFFKNHKSGAFRHIGTFDVMDGNGSEVAEIIDFSKNGKQIVYTDAGDHPDVDGSVGFVDISDPSNPVGDGKVFVDGSPTSLVVKGPWVLVVVDTSFNGLADDEDPSGFDNPSGKLLVINRHTRSIVANHDLEANRTPSPLPLMENAQRSSSKINAMKKKMAAFFRKNLPGHCSSCASLGIQPTGVSPKRIWTL